MVAYSFQPCFVLPIRIGLGLDRQNGAGAPEAKRQTIRAERNHPGRHARPGETLQLYCRQRSQGGFKIADVRCTQVRPIRLTFGRKDSVFLNIGSVVSISPPTLDAFARRDGFADWQALRDFWRVRHPGVTDFKGVLIEWESIT